MLQFFLPYDYHEIWKTFIIFFIFLSNFQINVLYLKEMKDIWIFHKNLIITT